jgi:hypothetical protein
MIVAYACQKKFIIQATGQQVDKIVFLWFQLFDFDG